MTAKYVVFEGIDGTGKSTQAKKTAQYLREQGFSVLETKEPGTQLLPITMELRNLMLNSEFDSQITNTARELLSQAIRSIHVEKLILESLDKYDYIIQDRGVLSNFAYGNACGNSIKMISDINMINIAALKGRNNYYDLYDKVILLKGDPINSLNRAANSKKEFEQGDALEAKGTDFMKVVGENMQKYSTLFNTAQISIDNKDIESVFDEIKKILNVEKK